MPNKTEEHTQRVRDELIEAGITKYGLLKLESRYLPKLLHPDEHIGGIAYGRYKRGSAMLIATDKRVIFLDRMPFFTITDELTYDVVSGVGHDVDGRFASIVLHTRLGDYGLSFVNPRVANKFVEFLEGRRLEGITPHAAAKKTPKATKKESAPMPQKTFTSDEQAFLLNHDLATLSTIDRQGKPQAAVVYYIVGENNNLYMITKEGTDKVHNILANPYVALTIYDAQTLETMQISAQAGLEPDAGIRQNVFQQIVKPRKYGPDIKWPPVSKLQNGSYIVVRIAPEDIKFRQYG